MEARVTLRPGQHFWLGMPQFRRVTLVLSLPIVWEGSLSAIYHAKLVSDDALSSLWSGFLYLSMVLDVWSRRIVGWAMESHLRTELVLAATNMALAQLSAQERHPSQR